MLIFEHVKRRKRIAQTYHDSLRQECPRKPNNPALPAFPDPFGPASTENLSRYALRVFCRVHANFLAVLDSPRVLVLDGQVQAVLL